MMVLKLSILAAVTVLCCIAIIPVQSHAVAYDPANQPPRWSLGGMLANMHLTPTTSAALIVILLAAIFAATQIVRGSW